MQSTVNDTERRPCGVWCLQVQCWNVGFDLRIASVGLDHVDVLLSGQLARVEALDHLYGCAGIAGKRQQVDLVAIEQSEHDAGMPQAVDRAGFALRPGLEAQVVKQIVELVLKFPQRGIPVAILGHENVVLWLRKTHFRVGQFQLLVHSDCFGHRHDWRIFSLALWQRQAQVDLFRTHNFYMLVLHIFQVSWSNKAIDHELNHLRQVGRKFQRARRACLCRLHLRRGADKFSRSSDERPILGVREPSSRLVFFLDGREIRHRKEQLAVKRILHDFVHDSQVPLNGGGCQVGPDLPHEVLQGSERNTRKLHRPELGQYSLVEHVDVVVVRHLRKLATLDPRLLRLKHLACAYVESRALRECLASRLGVQNPVISRLCELDCFLLVGSLCAELDRLAVFKAPDLPERACFDSVDFELVWIPAHRRKAVRDRHSTR